MKKDQLIVSFREERKEESVAPRTDDSLNRTKKRRGKVLLVVVSLAVALLISLGLLWYLYVADKAMSMPFVQNTDTAEDTIARVGKHIVLPTGEVPVVAKVSDPEKLTEQPFFSNAKVGDVVLIYTASQKAILYDPVRDILVEVATIITEPQ